MSQDIAIEHNNLYQYIDDELWSLSSQVKLHVSARKILLSLNKKQIDLLNSLTSNELREQYLRDVTPEEIPRGVMEKIIKYCVESYPNSIFVRSI